MRLSVEQLKAVCLFFALGGAPVGIFVWGEVFPHGLLGDTSPPREKRASAPRDLGGPSRAQKGPKERQIAGQPASIAGDVPPGAPDLSKEHAPKNQGRSKQPNLEDQFVTELRALGFQRPKESLALAREAREAFPDGATIAERTWYEARALVELGEFREAQAVARWLVERDPTSSFSLDLERHLLSHPLGLPPRRHPL